VYQQRVVIVGAGIIGLSTAYALLKQGLQRVTVLEQATVDHRRATSHGLSRLLRFEYGADMLYSEMVQLSLQRWRNLERCTRRVLYTPTGLLVLGNENDNITDASYHVLRELGLTPEYISRRYCTQTFPQFSTQDYDTFTYNANAGLLHASTCLRTLREAIIDLGGVFVENQRVMRFSHDNKSRSIRLFTDSGDEILTDRVVLATGPWVHHLLGDLHLPVHITRQYLLYYANLTTTTFGSPAFPAFMAGDLYGFPIHNTCTGSGPCWLKAAAHTFGAPVEPDEIPVVDDRVIAQVARKLCDLLPALQEAELAHVDSCMYDVSIDGDFILDYLPDDPRIIFATGLTGHGFKFGPLLGELLSSMICETTPVVPMDRFRLARFPYLWRTQAHSVA